MIRLEGVTKRFGDVTAVDEAHLCVDRGEVVALLGPSGCGKTTLLRLIAGFERPDAGTVEVAAPRQRRPAPGSRRRSGASAWSSRTTRSSRTSPSRRTSASASRAARARTRVAELLDIVGLTDQSRRYPHELSGGQQQRVALARALAPSPELILLDEPWSNVDPHLRETLRAEVAEIFRPLGVTVVLVTHDREEAFSLADRIALMRDGRVVQEGTSEELYFAPASRWAAEFVGAANVLSGDVVGGLVRTPLGSVPGERARRRRGTASSSAPSFSSSRPTPPAPAEVVAREFRGHDVLYRVLLEGVELVSQRPSTEVVPLGSRVSIRLHDGRVPVVD